MDLKYFFKHAKWQYLALIFIITLFIASVTTTQAVSRKRAKARGAQVQEKNKTPEKAGEEALSAWNIIEMTDWLFWPFVLLTSTGLLLLTYKGLKEFREKSRAKMLVQQQISTGDLRRVIRLVQGGQPNRAARLLHQMIATFNKTGRAEPIGDDINTYLVSERDSFETFNRVMGFLSDTAGAMGLLGTVWGIFETFHAGKMDGPTILQGMSISLVTTLVGLVISLVLNMGTTAIFAFFNRQLNLLATRAEELRQALLYIEAKSSTNGKSTPPVARKPKTVAPQYQQPAASPYRQPVEAVVPVEAGTGEVIDDTGYM